MSKQTSSALDEKFWSRFAKSYWERKPLVLKSIKSDLLQLGDTEVFKLLVAAADQSRKDKAPLGFKFFVNGIRSSDYETMYVLPKRSDKTLLGYHERMERIYQDYCLVCDELLQVNKDKQHLLTEFTKDLYRHVGFPNRFVEMGLYLGNYRKTPFGVHVDACGVFSFPVIGKKQFRTWTHSYVQKHPELKQSFRYAKHKASSQLLVAATGDMAYWPSSVWHIAESDGSFSATWSLGVWVDRPTAETITESVMSLLLQNLGEAAQSPSVKISRVHKADGELDQLPEVFEQAIASLKSLSTDELKDAFARDWMKRVSSHGLKTAAQNYESFRLDEALKLRHSNSPILWSRVEKSASGEASFAYSFAGSDPQISKSKALLKLIRDLNSGKLCVLKYYFKGPARSEDRKVIQQLGKLGAFVT